MYKGTRELMETKQKVKKKKLIARFSSVKIYKTSTK